MESAPRGGRIAHEEEGVAGRTEVARVFLLLVIGGLSCSPAAAMPSRIAQDPPPYEKTLTQARAQLAQKQYDESLRTLERLLTRYPQDYTATLLAGWAAFNGEHYRRALRYYRRAVALSGGAFDAKAGVAWTLQRLGAREKARARFLRLARQAPKDRMIQRGLRLTQTRWLLAPYAGFEYHGYTKHTERLAAYGGVAGLALTYRSFTLRSAYRFTRVEFKADGSGNPAIEFGQHEAYLSMGYAKGPFAIAGHYAFVDDGNITDSRIHLAGLSLAGKLWGSAPSIEGNVGIYTDDTVLNVAAGWRWPIGRGWVEPTLSVQRVDATNLAAGGLSAGLRLGPVDAWVGGRYGEQRHAALLGYQLLNNTGDIVAMQAWAGLSLSITSALRIDVGYAVDKLSGAARAGNAAALAHHASLTLTWNNGPLAKESSWKTSQN
jgi:hypothetical protein